MLSVFFGTDLGTDQYQLKIKSSKSSLEAKYPITGNNRQLYTHIGTSIK